MQELKTKTEERKRLLALRRSFQGKAEKERLIAENLLSSSVYGECDEVFIYISMSFEIDTSLIIDRAFSDGKAVFAPICKKNGVMNFQRIQKGEKLVRSPQGILEPRLDRSRAALPGRSSLIVVPALAFDRSGNRIGFGGGYYDRFLSQTESGSIGLCFEEFFLPELPKEDHDVPVSFLATEKGIYSFQE